MDNLIQFNFKSWTDSKLPLDVYIFLLLLYEENLDKAEFFYDSFDTTITRLQELGYIKITGDTILDIKLRDKGITLFQNLDVDLLATKIRELFPKGVYTGGLPVRSSTKEITGKLKKFSRVYKYSEEIIIRATEKYIEKKRDEGWQFMKTASYFIFKDSDSVLAALCEAVDEGEDDTVRSNNKMI